MAPEELLTKFVQVIINPAILLVFAAGFFLFVWGLVQFLMDLEDGKNREEGIEHMKWGIVGMFVMVSVYGILALIDNTFELGALSGQQPDISRFENSIPNNTYFNTR